MILVHILLQGVLREVPLTCLPYNFLLQVNSEDFLDQVSRLVVSQLFLAFRIYD